MSWKSFVTAGLLCVLATPVFAAPTISITKGGTAPGSNGHLNSAGNWVWLVSIDADDALTPPAPNGGPNPDTAALAVELGFQVTGASLVSVTNINPTVWDKTNPGTPIFPAWQNTTPGDPSNCGAAYNNNPCGIKTNGNEIFVALGSALVPDAQGPQALLEIVTTGPAVGQPSMTTGIQLLGAYSGDAVIAQTTGYDSGTSKYTAGAFLVDGTFSRTAHPGDATMNGTTDFADLTAVLQNYNQSPRIWSQGNFNSNAGGVVDFADLTTVLQNYNTSGGSGLEGGGAASGSAVPEPATVALVGLSALGLAGLRRRRS